MKLPLDETGTAWAYLLMTTRGLWGVYTDYENAKKDAEILYKFKKDDYTVMAYMMRDTVSYNEG